MAIISWDVRGISVNCTASRLQLLTIALLRRRLKRDTATYHRCAASRRFRSTKRRTCTRSRLLRLDRKTTRSSSHCRTPPPRSQPLMPTLLPPSDAVQRRGSTGAPPTIPCTTARHDRDEIRAEHGFVLAIPTMISAADLNVVGIRRFTMLSWSHKC